MEELNLHEIEPMAGPDRELKEEKISKKTMRYAYNSLTDGERKIYKILSDEPVYIDDVVKESGVESRLASKALLSLELKRLIKELPGKQFIRLCI